MATLILMYGATFRGDETVRGILLTSVMFLSIGLTFGTLMTGITFKFWDMRVYETLLWVAMSFGAIYIVNRLVPIQYVVTSPVSLRWLNVLQGVSEECFFRVWICGVASKFSTWGAIIGSSAIWSAYHIARYGGNLNVLLVVFCAGCILGWVYLESRFADGVIFAHALVNFIS